MSAYLAYSYITRLTAKKQNGIDEKTKKAREEFSKGFMKGTSISLVVYYFYLFTRAVQPRSTVSKPGFEPLSEGTGGTFLKAALRNTYFYLGFGFAIFLVIVSDIFNRPNNT